MDDVKWRQGFAYVTFSSKEEAVKALLELNGKLVDGRVVIRDTTKVVKQNRPFHIKDLNKILARSVAVFLGFGSIGMGWLVIGQEWVCSKKKQRKLKSSPYCSKHRPNSHGLLSPDPWRWGSMRKDEKPTMISHEIPMSRNSSYRQAFLNGDFFTYQSLKDYWLDDGSNMWEQIIMKSCQPFLCCLIVSTTVQGSMVCIRICFFV